MIEISYKNGIPFYNIKASLRGNFHMTGSMEKRRDALFYCDESRITMDCTLQREMEILFRIIVRDIRYDFLQNFHVGREFAGFHPSADEVA